MVPHRAAFGGLDGAMLVDSAAVLGIELRRVPPVLLCSTLPCHSGKGFWMASRLDDAWVGAYSVVFQWYWAPSYRTV